MNTLFFAAFLILGVTGGLIGTSIPFLTTYFHAPPDQAGLFVTLQTVGGMLANIVVGRWLDRYESRRIMWLMPAAFVLSGVVMMLATSWAGGLVAMFIFGCGFGGLLVAGNTIVTRVNLPNAAPALNIMSLCFGIGAAVGPQIVRQILVTQPIPVAYLVIGAAQCIMLPFMLRHSLPPPVRHENHTPVSVSLLWVALFGAFLFFYTGAEVGFSAWISTQMTHMAGIAVTDGALFVSLFWVGITAGRALASVITRRVSNETILIGAAGTVFISIVLLLAFPTSITIGAIATFAFGFFCGPVYPSALALVGQRYPDAVGQISGTLHALGNLGVALIPWLQGQVSGGLSGGYTVTAVCEVVLLVLAILIARDSRRAVSSRPQTA
ncbi:MAG: MFS transporter [Anaerolineae bacterium]